MLGQVEVFLSHEHTLTKEVLVDLLSISFWDKPGRTRLAGSFNERENILHCCEFLALFGESHTTLKFVSSLSKMVVRINCLRSYV